MKVITGQALVSHNDGNAFMKNLGEAIEKFQADGAEVEVQYSTQLTTETVMFSALLLGRKEGNFNGK